MAVTTSSVVGIIAGNNPLVYSSSAPYTVFLFQAVFIIILCQLLHIPLKKIQQPKVIAEVVAGILLGPSVMGHIPNFTSTCFSPASIPGLTLFANIGIILFLFIIGLEVDVSFIKKNARVALTVGLINMAIPFALGCGIARGMYNEYRQNDTEEGTIKFTTYMVFIAVAMCITAFPVLARILTDLNLIGDRVGTIVLAAGIANDLTGWILLALVVSLANADDGINTLYILLLAAAWFLFLCYPVRLILKKYLNRFTNDLGSGEPSQISMTIILVLVFISAFFTDIIGVHPIFGAFMVGVIIPRDNGYVIKITEKLEDLVHIVFIPLYFAVTGLNVNLGLLNRGIDWAYIIAIICLAMFGKIFGGFIAAKFNKLFWRESLAVGVLMSCKGIVEIVVLNVGLNAGIISQRVYSMFIVMALVTTFATTPLAIWTYPVEYREKVAKYLNGEIDWEGNAMKKDEDDISTSLLESKTPLMSYSIEELSNYKISKIVLLLRKIDTISYLMSFVKLFTYSGYRSDIKALHLREFSSRTSHLLEASSGDNFEQAKNESNEYESANSSSILSIIKAFSDVLGIEFASKSILVPLKNHTLAINDQISRPSDLLLSSIRSTKLISASQEGESNDCELYKRLFKNCRSHMGLLLICDASRSTEGPSDVHEHSEVRTLNHEDFVDSVPRTLLELKTINLILNHDNLLSSSDLLCLHLVYKLTSNLSNVNIFIKSSIVQSKGFESQIGSLIKSNAPMMNFNITYLKGSNDFTNEILKFHPCLTGEMFFISNDVNTDDSLFGEDVSELVKLSIEKSFNVLVIKAGSLI